MKRIFGFNEFVNENYRLNEGGGAGIDFKTDVDINLTLELSASGLTEASKKIEMADTFDAEGYDDGMNEVGTWMLKSGLDLKLDKLENKIKQIPIGSVSDDSGLFDDLGIEEAAREDVKKLGDLFIAQPELVLNVTFNISFKNYREMHFAGYIRGKFEKGDLIIGGDAAKYDNGDYDSITLSSGSGRVEEFELNFDSQVAELIDDVKPQLTATATFVEFYTNVFDRTNENFDAYIKAELLENDIEADEVDEEIQEYIDNNDLEITIDDFKKEKEKYVNDEFIDFMKDKDDYHTRKWDNYWSGLKDDYGKDNPAGLEQE